MQPFDLELAKQGHPLLTRKGLDARIICFDRIDTKRLGHIIALVSGLSKRYEQICIYRDDGRSIEFISDLDLTLKDE